MTHLDDDTLLLLAYGELPEDGRDAALAHLADCAPCRSRLEPLERGRVALDWAMAAPAAPASAAAAEPRLQPRQSRRLLIGAVLAAAAMVALILLLPHTGAPTAPSSLGLRVPRYVSPALAPIDTILTRLEQERAYAMP